MVKWILVGIAVVLFLLWSTNPKAITDALSGAKTGTETAIENPSSIPDSVGKALTSETTFPLWLLVLLLIAFMW